MAAGTAALPLAPGAEDELFLELAPPPPLAPVSERPPQPTEIQSVSRSKKALAACTGAFSTSLLSMCSPPPPRGQSSG